MKIDKDSVPAGCFFFPNGMADWIHRPSAIQRARAAARRDPPDRLVPRPPNDHHPVPPSRTQRAFLFKTFGRAPVHFLPHTLSLGLALSLYLPRSHIHPEILSDFGPIAPPARGRPAIESSGDRTQVSISSSALASLDPHDFDQVFLIFFALFVHRSHRYRAPEIQNCRRCVGIADSR